MNGENPQNNYQNPNNMNNGNQPNYNNYQDPNNMNNGNQFNNYQNPNQGIVYNNGTNTYQAPQQNNYPQPTYTPVEEKEENVLLGTVGALIGALLGGVSIYLLIQINVIASLSGLLISGGALYGYELLGHKLSKKGILISCIIMVLAVYVSYRATMAIELTKLTSYSFWEAFSQMPEIVKEGGVAKDYYLVLIEILAFCVGGSIGLIRVKLAQAKKAKNNN